MNKPSEVHFADERVKKAFEELAKSTTEEKQLYERLSRALMDIQKNAFCKPDSEKSVRATSVAVRAFHDIYFRGS